MQCLRRVGLAVLLCVLVVLGVCQQAKAESVTVTIGVGDTILTVGGKTSPNAFVTILLDGGVIGTTTATPAGTYTSTFPAQSPGLHELKVYGFSSGGVNTDTVTLTINIIEHATTTADIFLPSTVVTEDTTLEQGQTLNLSGETFPDSTVKVFIDNTEFVTATADTQGNWSISAITSALAGGQHEFFLRVIDGLGNQSYPSALRYFTLAAPPSTETPPSGTGAPPIPSITFPASGTLWQQPTITVTGTGAPFVQIELWDGSRPLGSVWSQANGDWSITLGLEPRDYQLRARACLLGKCSAFSPTVFLTYQPTGQAHPGEGLIISLPQLSYFIFEDTEFTVRPTILNGTAPYTTTMQWGDGAQSIDTHAGKQFALIHTYFMPGKYTATLFAADTEGRTGSIQFTVDVQPADSPFWWLFILLCLLVLILIAYSLSRRNQKQTEDAKKRST